MRLGWCIFFFTSTNKNKACCKMSVRKLYGFYPATPFKLNQKEHNAVYISNYYGTDLFLS